MTESDLEQNGRIRARVGRAIVKEARQGLILAAWVRTGAVALIALWLMTDTTTAGAAQAWQVGSVIVFLLTGLLHVWAARNGAPNFKAVYTLIAFDVMFLTLVAIFPNPFLSSAPTPALLVRFVGSYWVFILLVQVAFAQSPRLILWTGGWILATHAAQTVYLLLQPNVVTEFSLESSSHADFHTAYLTSNFVYVFQRIGEMVFAIAITAIAATLVARSRRLVVQQALTERSRGQLARYVPAPVVDEIERGVGPFRAPERREVAVAFIDIVGFTRFTDTHSPEDVMAMLREYHAFSVDIVFRHGGAIDKFIGDGIMATFGITDQGSEAHSPADSALRAAHDLIAQAEFWNEEREKSGEEAIRVSIGLDYGPAVFGNVGVAQRLELAVIGDPVNVAARIERITRDHDAVLAVTDRLLERASPPVNAMLDLYPVGEIVVRGREKPLGVSVLAPHTPVPAGKEISRALT